MAQLAGSDTSQTDSAKAYARRRMISRGTLHHRLASAAAAAGRSPLTLSLLLAQWVLGAATGSLLTGPSLPLLHRIGVGVPSLSQGHWWSPLSSLLWAPGLADYVCSALVLLLLLAPAERRLGTARTAVVLVAGQILGALLGTGLIALGADAGVNWLQELAQWNTAAPTTGALAVGLAASHAFPAVWQRRARLLVTIVPLVLFLYVGHVQDVLRLGGIAVGLLAVPAVVHRKGAALPRTRPATQAERRVLTALLVGSFAVGPAVGALYRDAVGPFHTLAGLFAGGAPDDQLIDAYCANSRYSCHFILSRADLPHEPAPLTALIFPLLLLVLAAGLRRGLRVAWRLTGLVLTGWLGLLVYRALTVPAEPTAHEPRAHGGAAVPALLWQILLLGAVLVLVLALLVRARGLFVQRMPLHTARRTGALIAGALVATCLAYAVVDAVAQSALAPQVSMGRLVLSVFHGALPASSTPPVDLGVADPPGGGVPAVRHVLDLLFWATTLITLYATFRRPRVHGTDEDARRARALLTEYGGSTLSYLTTWDGNHYWFSDCGRAAVAYRVCGTVALTTCGPFGDRDARAEAVAGFARYCDARGWTPAFYSVDAGTREQAGELGWKSLQVAVDTVVPLPELAFKGKKWQDVRTALNRAAKEGITAQWCSFSEAPAELRDRVRAISEEWVSDKGLPEMGFTLGGLDELDDPRVRCLLAVDEEGGVHGVTSWMPVYADGGAGRPVGWTIDLMRRRGDGFRSSMEFLIASAALTFKEEGAEFLSLSGAPLAREGGDGGDEEATPVLLNRVLDYAGKSLEPVYGFRSLLHFKAKFQPEYRPLYLSYPDPAALPGISRAISKAYLPRLSPGQAVRLVRRFFS
ncbi:DUF2156 domain-containing protein [Streptomyces sp. ODS28]|uniref:bifunctional lysylphosphatidylglycerol flippase/synthetase MprF n=1 Tax=Streptomyces sp. ODS28 TaxID=3136688 RepID=UPI0031ED3285